MTEQSPNICLHCKIVDLIYAHYREQQQLGPNDDVMLPIADIVSNVGQFMAEMFASEDSSAERKRRTKEFHRAICDAIPHIRARGEGAFPRQIKAH